MTMQNENGGKKDHGEIVTTHRAPIAWVWIFPLLAIIVAGWLFWTQWQQRGPEIQISFDEAPGIQAGKTKLIYRGVDSGTVESVELDENLKRVVVRVRLKSFAYGLATKGTDFWIDRPVVSITELTGLESIIQGNSIQARTQGGPYEWQFNGLPKPPLLPLEPGAFTIKLQADKIPFINRGAPVYHRGIRVGVVRKKDFEADGRPTLHIYIEKEFYSTVRSSSRFWPIQAASLQVGQHGAKLDITGMDAIVQGGLAFDHFENPGDPANIDALFDISSNEFDARASGRLLAVTFEDGRGLVAGETKVCYLGHPIGLVDSIQAIPSSGFVRTAVRLDPAYEKLANSATSFTLIRPRISLDGVTGLDTILTGVYIEINPGQNGQPAQTFAGRSVTDKEWQRLQAERDGLQVTLFADKMPTIDKGAPVIFRGVNVGSVLEKTIDKNLRPILRIVIRPEYRNILTANSRFWRFPATSIKAGPGVLEVELEGLETLLQGGVAFDNFGHKSEPAKAGSEFHLYPEEQIARTEATPIRIRLENGRGLVPNRSELRYLGIPVGMVENVVSEHGQIYVTARLNDGYSFLRREDSIFSVIRPNISLRGITGLETLVSGVYIECTPGNSKKLADSFIGKASIDSEEITPSGLTVKLESHTSPVNVGAAVYYRGINVGRVTEKSLSADGSNVVLTAVINRKYSNLVHENTKFWDASGLKATLGFLKFRIQTESVIAPDGQISFATPDKSGMGKPARDGDSFTLYPNSQSEWHKWNPQIPLPKN